MDGTSSSEAGTSAESSAATAPASDGDLPLFDEAGEKVIFDRLVRMDQSASASQSRKKRKLERQAKNVCHEWRRNGSCRWGNKCKFGHPSASDKEANDDEENAAEEENGAADDATGVASAAADGEAVAGSAADVSSSAVVCSSESSSSSSSAEPEPPVGSGGPIDRYFFMRYAVDTGGIRGHDVGMAVHSNRNIAVLMLAPSHPIRRLGLTVTNVEFGSGRTYNGELQPFTGVVTSGKHKRGQLFVHPPTVVATLTTTDGRAFPIRACVTAGVIEVNERLLAHPELVNARPRTEGYIAVFQVKPQKVQALLGSMLNREAYADLLKLRRLDALADVVRTQGRDDADTRKALCEEGGEY